MNRFVAIACAIALAGCALKGQSLPGFQPDWASADYTVLGRTNYEECGTYVFIDWGHLFVNESAAATSANPIAGLLPGPGNTAEAKRALYHALDKVPEATHLLEPRVHVQWNGFGVGPIFLFGRRCATVEAHGVRIGDRPVPNAH